MNPLPTITRGVIVVVRKQAFFDWANKLIPGKPLSPGYAKEQTAFLITDEYSTVESVIKKYFKTIFEEMLFGTWTNPDDWPQTRTFEIFNEWFSCHVCSLVFDLENKKLIHDVF